MWDGSRIGPALALALLIALAAFRLGVELQPSPAMQGRHEDAAYLGQAEERAPLFQPQAEGAQSQRGQQYGRLPEPLGQWLGRLFEFRLTDVLLVFFTGLLAIRTTGLFKETAGLRKAGEDQIRAAQTAANAAAKSADTAERALTTTERAYLFFVDTIEIKDDPRLKERHFTVAFENFGRSPAIISSFRIDIVPAPRITPPKPKETGKINIMPSGAIVGPGTEWTRERWPFSKFVSRLPLGQFWYLCGDITYRDLLNDPKLRRTWFCRRIDSRGKFTLQDLNDPELNGYE